MGQISKNKDYERSFWIYRKNLCKKKIIMHNDLIILFALFQVANSYQYINEIGYFYIRIIIIQQLILGKTKKKKWNN